ncbi:hypothetical protein DPMN_000934 [Dreissena polymorpha]|uniref:Uncharacterized protein n=1 Tax=Dreissena polymorpha TaxID=45954 RepID=A0A9D4RSB9_DREPO|nr:hypothetical protein DPMN_000934 [Dreissena polymorpha]
MSGEDRRVRVWDLRTGTPFKEFRGHTDVIYTLSFNQSSSMLASGKSINTFVVMF